MPGFGYGVRRAFLEIITGAITALMMDSFAKTGLIPYGYLLFFNLINGLGTALLFFVMPVWATAYLIGWIVGMIIMFNSGLVSIWDMISYFIIPLIVIYYRLTN
jgi:hypothetical protein